MNNVKKRLLLFYYYLRDFSFGRILLKRSFAIITVCFQSSPRTLKKIKMKKKKSLKILKNKGKNKEEKKTQQPPFESGYCYSYLTFNTELSFFILNNSYSSKPSLSSGFWVFLIFPQKQFYNTFSFNLGSPNSLRFLSQNPFHLSFTFFHLQFSFIPTFFSLGVTLILAKFNWRLPVW